MKTPIFTGCAPAIVTPMHADGSVNYEAFRTLIEYQLSGNVDAICVCGTTGEASAMNDKDHLDVIEYCVNTVNGRVPVIAGTGSNDTHHAVSLSVEAVKRGADALLQVTPYYNKTNQSGLIKHFLTVTEAADVPVILYNVPSRTGMSITPATYKELSKHPLIAGVKEASGDIAHIANVVATCGDDLPLYSGNDDQIVPLLSLGGKGVISVLGNIVPQAVHDMCTLFFEGKLEESLALQLKYLPLNNALFCDVNPIPVKAAVSLTTQIGIDAGICRLPLGHLSEEHVEYLKRELRNVGLTA